MDKLGRAALNAYRSEHLSQSIVGLLWFCARVGLGFTLDMFSANAHSVVHYHHEWSAEEEVQLFHAMEGLRPVGINKHFYMSCIAQRLSKALNREIPSELIWKHLGTMYKLKELDDLESLPFPNEEREFSLPEQDYGALLKSVDTPTAIGEEKDSTDAVVGNETLGNGKASALSKVSGIQLSNSVKDADKDKKAAAAAVKLLDLPKRPSKRTRGSMSNESISPSTTPPPVQSSKRRRI